MKKMIALSLTVLLALTMAACARPQDPGAASGSSVSGSSVSGANAAVPDNTAQELESPVENDDKYITVMLEDELSISYPITFSVDTKARGMLLSVAQPEGSNIIVSCENIASDGLEKALSEEVLKAQLEAQGSTLVKYQQVVCGSGHGAKLWAKADGTGGSVRNQIVFILINSTKTRAYYIILTTKDKDFKAFGGMEKYILLK